MFARGVDLNIALGGTFESMILIFIFIVEETTFGQKNCSHIFKEEK